MLGPGNLLWLKLVVALVAIAATVLSPLEARRLPKQESPSGPFGTPTGKASQPSRPTANASPSHVRISIKIVRLVEKGL